MMSKRFHHFLTVLISSEQEKVFCNSIRGLTLLVLSPQKDLTGSQHLSLGVVSVG